MIAISETMTAQIVLKVQIALMTNLSADRSISLITSPILESSSGRQHFVSISFSKTKGHLPQGVQLDLLRRSEAVLLYSMDNLNTTKKSPEDLCQLPSQWWVTNNFAVTRTVWPPWKYELYPFFAHFQDYLPPTCPLLKDDQDMLCVIQ